MCIRDRFTLTERLQALTVDIIRRLWDHGYLHNNPWAQRVHDTWFHHWVDVKTANTMDDVDRQAEELVELWEAEEDPAIDAYVLSEQLEGETPLGGEIRATHRSVLHDVTDENADRV